MVFTKDHGDLVFFDGMLAQGHLTLWLTCVSHMFLHWSHVVYAAMIHVCCTLRMVSFVSLRETRWVAENDTFQSCEQPLRERRVNQQSQQ